MCCAWTFYHGVRPRDNQNKLNDFNYHNPVFAKWPYLLVSQSRLIRSFCLHVSPQQDYFVIHHCHLLACWYPYNDPIDHVPNSFVPCFWHGSCFTRVLYKMLQKYSYLFSKMYYLYPHTHASWFYSKPFELSHKTLRKHCKLNKLCIHFVVLSVCNISWPFYATMITQNLLLWHYLQLLNLQHMLTQGSCHQPP